MNMEGRSSSVLIGLISKISGFLISLTGSTTTSGYTGGLGLNLGSVGFAKASILRWISGFAVI
jgi:hypothetical protein